MALIERGLFCLALSFLAKFGFHERITTWVMFVAATAYIVRGIVIGLAD